jgi:RND superfamily putative drug exporter
MGRSVVRHPWRAISIWLVVVLACAAAAFWGFGQGGVFDRLENSLSLVPDTESDQVNQAMTDEASGETITVVVSGLDLKADAGDIAAFMADHRGDLAKLKNVDSEFDPFMLPDLTAPQAAAYLSDKEDGFIIALTLKDGLHDGDMQDTIDRVDDAVADLQAQLRADWPKATARDFSSTIMVNTVMDQVKLDLVKGEAVGVPIALILMIIVFGGVLAAGMPIIGAIAAIAVGMGSLWAMTFATTVETFTINITSIIGLALSIDYGLLIVSRYREELARALVDHGYPGDGSRVPRKHAAQPVVRDALEATIRTAGRTVFFSALTIALALCALMVMKAPMLRIIGLSGMIVTLMAVLTATTLVPAVLTLLNRAIIKPSVVTRIPGLRSLVKAVGDSASDHGFFSKLAHWVHRHPWWIMGIVFVLLLTMASPLLNLQTRTAFTDYLPPNNDVTRAYDSIDADYPALQQSSIVVLADAPPSSTGDLVKHLEGLTDVDYVSAPTVLPTDSGRTLINVHVDVANQVGSEVTGYVKDLRAYDAGFGVEIGGSAALQMDFVQSIIDRAWAAGLIMVLAVFVLMFLMTGSLIVPLKAIIINSLSLLASLGATTFIFMNGLLGMPKVMGMETFILVCGLCFGFGLAMDYEVFLLTRVKEFWDKGLTNDEAVERGLQRSGRIITSAAAIIVAVFIGFTFGEMVPIKEIGVALAATVVIDATLVRMLLVPATMTVLGKWNWWAPKPLHWVYSRLKIVH